MNRWKRWFAVCPVILLALACGGGGDGESEEPKDLSGRWAGTWAGNDPAAGPVSGNWEANVAEVDGAISGTFFLTGDADCTDGTMAGVADTATKVLTGTISRPPCPQNEWQLTALEFDKLKGSGIWTQPGSGAEGNFTGKRIGEPGGPQISFFSPPGGLPGTIVTIVGERFASSSEANSLVFNNRSVEPTLVEDSVLIAPAPANFSTGSLFLTTDDGHAVSPREFFREVFHPDPFLAQTLSAGLGPEGLAFSPDGHRLYVANRGAGTVTMVDVASGQILAATILNPQVPISPQGMAMSPDGRRLFVSAGSGGVKVLHPGTASIIGTFGVPAGDGAAGYPKNIAVSPDGRRLYVADTRPGGAVRMLDAQTGQMLATIPGEGGMTPAVVAVHPDGTEAFFALSADFGPGTLAVFDPAAGSVVASAEVGADPAGIAVAPDGSRIYVANGGEDTVSVIDVMTLDLLAEIPVGEAPTGLAVSPDGALVLVANRGGNSVSFLDTTTLQVTATVPVGSGPVGLAISPSGDRAYVAHGQAGTIGRIGGAVILNVILRGTGLGSVSSSPAGISCGSNCRAEFKYGTQVRLSARTENSSYTYTWGGDADCSDGMVTMTANTTCIAYFSAPLQQPCFIATAAFGDPMHPHVQAFREFRERYVRSAPLGPRLIDLYNRHSPAIAAYLERHENARSLVRLALIPLVFVIRYPWVMVLLLAAVTLAAVTRRGWKRRRCRAD